MTRKSLCHHPPFPAVDSWYFITICAADHRPWVASVGGDHRAPRDSSVGGDHRAPRDLSVGGDHRAPRDLSVGGDHRAPRTFDEIATAILDEARFFHTQGKWFVSLFLVMPDHLHFIVHGPPGGRPLPLVIGDFKRYLTNHFGLAIQRDFFDTRIRDDAHYGEKWRYIVRNPVTRGLVATPREWPHVIAFNRDTGEERTHR